MRSVTALWAWAGSFCADVSMRGYRRSIFKANYWVTRLVFSSWPNNAFSGLAFNGFVCETQRLANAEFD
jgi:hypothetical protein